MIWTDCSVSIGHYFYVSFNTRSALKGVEYFRDTLVDCFYDGFEIFLQWHTFSSCNVIPFFIRAVRRLESVNPCRLPVSEINSSAISYCVLLQYPVNYVDLNVKNGHNNCNLTGRLFENCSCINNKCKTNSIIQIEKLPRLIPCHDVG